MKAPILYSPMMGMGLGDDIFAASVAVVIEDYMFESTTANELTPLATGTASDFNDAYDLDGTDYMPEVSPGDEGYWDDFPEMITYGDFEGGTTGWTKGATASATQEIVGGALKMYSGTSGDNSNIMSETATSHGYLGRVYRLNITSSNFVSSDTGYIRLDGIYSAADIISFEAGIQSVYFTAYRNFSKIQFFASGHSDYYTIDNVSLVEYAITPLDV